MRSLRSFAVVMASVISGCAGTDTVLFATKTSLGVDFDTKPPALQVAYDRTEGYFAPRYSNGTLPPVLATIDSDGAIFDAQVRQIYATGNAARILASSSHSTVGSDKLLKDGKERLAFFGTSTTSGLKVGFTNNLPDSFLFGFRRKEISFIPLGETVQNGATVHIYPPVLAAIDTTAAASGDASGPKGGLKNAQFFATGIAAEELALNDAVGLRAYFKSRANAPIEAYIAAVAAQEKEMATLFACYASLPPDRRQSVWANADELGLLPPGRRAQLASEPSAPRANALYTSELRQPAGERPARVNVLGAHRRFVCGQARAGG